MSRLSIGNIKGPKGDSATITVGTTTTGLPGTDASVTNVGTSSAAILNFVIPRGDKGDSGPTGPAGPTPNITIGTVTYGDTPTVTIDNTDPNNPKLNFVLKTSEVGVVDNLDSVSTTDALSANQGRILGERLNSKIDGAYFENGYLFLTSNGTVTVSVNLTGDPV